MNTNKKNDLSVSYMVYLAINTMFNGALEKADSKEDRLSMQKTHVIVLEDFAEKYLGVGHEVLLNQARKEIAQKIGKDVKDVRLSKLNLYYYKLGMIFWNSIPIIREFEMALES